MQCTISGPESIIQKAEELVKDVQDPKTKEILECLVVSESQRVHVLNTLISVLISTGKLDYKDFVTVYDSTLDGYADQSIDDLLHCNAINAFDMQGKKLGY